MPHHFSDVVLGDAQVLQAGCQGAPEALYRLAGVDNTRGAEPTIELLRQQIHVPALRIGGESDTFGKQELLGAARDKLLKAQFKEPWMNWDSPYRSAAMSPV